MMIEIYNWKFGPLQEFDCPKNETKKSEKFRHHSGSEKPGEKFVILRQRSQQQGKRGFKGVPLLYQFRHALKNKKKPAFIENSRSEKNYHREAKDQAFIFPDA
ncbi:unnamed protein product, partial [Notodromas monacha]